jgi:hypothetical protein
MQMLIHWKSWAAHEWTSWSCYPTQDAVQMRQVIVSLAKVADQQTADSAAAAADRQQPQQQPDPPQWRQWPRSRVI